MIELTARPTARVQQPTVLAGRFRFTSRRFRYSPSATRAVGKVYRGKQAVVLAVIVLMNPQYGHFPRLPTRSLTIPFINRVAVFSAEDKMLQTFRSLWVWSVACLRRPELSSFLLRDIVRFRLQRTRHSDTSYSWAPAMGHCTVWTEQRSAAL